jgi:pantoate--beta-alanine ligase
MSVRLVHTIAEVRSAHDEARRAGRTVGLVPTMGYLHAGHGSLMDAARADCGAVTATIFVNPLQFAAHEDLSTYPRDLAGDLALAEAHGVDVVFAPDVTEMYPSGPVLTNVAVRELTETLDGASRPGHFDGVATVVAKLFAIAGPCRAYFGEKDYQQLLVVHRMAHDLSFPVTVIGCPTVREPDGLAMSSRNVYLEPDDRAAAPVLKRCLDTGAAALQAGERAPATIEAAMATVLATEPRATMDYVAAVDARTLARPARLTGEVRLLVAARVGSARLIDNLGVHAD